MSDAAAAAEHLKVIRRMMEKATVYRALSAPAAIFGGLVACATGGYFLWRANTGSGLVDWREFFWIWVVALTVVDGFNTLLLWRKSRSAGEPFFSPAMVHAVTVLAPTLLVGGMISYEVLSCANEFELCAMIWVSCYGAALVAMGGAAPRSLRRLGWVFLAAGVFIFLIWRRFGPAVMPQLGIGELEAASWIMIGTFGLLHLGHGVGVLLRGGGDQEPM